MEENAVEAAEIYFTYGPFIPFPSAKMPFQSLRKVADSTSWLLDTNLFDPTANRFNPNFKSTYASDLILHAIRGTDVFSQTSLHERKDAILAGLKSLVLLPSAMGNMYALSTSDCSSSLFWDIGIAQIVGSIEGAAYGGDERKNGVSMFRLAEELCDSFDMCTSSGHARSNEGLMEYFTNGESMVSADKCEDAKTLMKQKVVPNMIGSLIQGIVKYSSSTSSKAKGYMYSLAMLPIVESINGTSSATLLENARLDKEGWKPALIEAFAHVIEDLNINCKDIGDVFCLEDVQPDTTDLSDGLYVTTTFVEHL